MPKPDGSPQELYLNFDLSGKAPENRIEAEVRFIEPFQKTFFALYYGSYFLESLRIFSRQANGELIELDRGLHFSPAAFNSQLTEKCGKDVYDLVRINVSDLPGLLSINYQAVGSAKQINTLALQKEMERAKVSTASVPFDSIQQKPETVVPKDHLHDLADFYGFDHLVSSWNDFKNALLWRNRKIGSDSHSVAEKPAADRVASIVSEINVLYAQFSQAISQHIAGTAHKHNYSPASVGLDLVGNYGAGGYEEVAGQPVLKYATPKAIADLLLNPPTATTSTHPTTRGAVHGENKQALGLGNVENFQLANTFVLGQNYGVFYFGNQVLSQAEKYIGNNAVGAAVEYVNVRSVGYASTEIGKLTAGPSDNPPSTARYSVLKKQINDSLTLVQNNASAVSQIAQASSDIVLALQEAETLNTRFDVIGKDVAMAEALTQLMFIDRIDVGGADPNLLFNLPSKIPGLYLWLDANNPQNQVRLDSLGRKRVVGLVDRSKNARLFSSTSVSTAPILRPSSDRQDGTGLLNRNTLAFEPGHFLDMVDGSYVCLQTGMTIIALVRTGPALSRFTLLSSAPGQNQSKIVLQGSESRAVTAIANGNWTAFRSPISSATPERSNVFVATIGERTQSANWATSTKAKNSAYPKGDNTPVGSWPASSFLSSPLYRIGSQDSNAVDMCEVTQVMLFNRPLSMPMTKAVIAYLRQMETSGQGLQIDDTVASAF